MARAVHGPRGGAVASPPMTTAQAVFAVALGAVTLLITGFALYVVSSTVWAGRWVRPRRRR